MGDLADRIAEKIVEATDIDQDMWRTERNAIAEIIRAELAPLLAAERRLRELLWLGHGHDGLYGDDGEMQCSRCGLDYKRDPVERIEMRLTLIRAARGARP